MKPPMDFNPCTKIWTTLSNNQLLSHRLSEWLKLIALYMAMVMGGIEDERCFSNLGFVKSKPRNILTTCLNLIVRIFAYKFFYL
jgi:hypothetical protein